MKKSLWFLISSCCLCLFNGCSSGGAYLTPPSPVATHFSVTSANSTPTAGIAFNITVTALDASGKMVATYSGTVHFTSSNGQAVLPASAMLSGGTGTFSVTVNAAGSQTITASDGALFTGPSNSINVSAAPAFQFSVTAPASAGVGAAFDFQVTAQDQFNNTAPAYAGMVHFTSSDGPTGLPANAPLTSGTGNFRATLQFIGPQTITATDTVTSSITGSSRSISVAVQGTLEITSVPPPSGTAGQAYDDTVVTVPCGPRSRDCICINNICVKVVSGTDGFRLTASGGAQAYIWSWAPAVGSSLPVGLDINSNTGIIYGVPRTAGSFNVAVTVTDSSSPPTHASANYALLINPPTGSPPTPAITTTAVPTTFALNLANAGFAFTANHGVPPYAWSVTPAPPPGLTFSDGGLLYGTPTTAGTFPITVTVRDSTGRDSAPVDFTIPVFSHGFEPTGSMRAVRDLHAATLLDNGKVLITGGDDERGDSSATADLFDPSNGTFTPTSSMGNPRLGHTATLLCHISLVRCLDDRVLVTGGGSAIAELFDPSSGSFAPTGTMATNRFAHTATLLNNGKVLVAGGGGGPATAELFDPSVGTFIPVSNMAAGRSNHTAVLLSTGKVLLIGGSDDNGISVATAELFDPANDTFTPTGSMATPRSGHTATLLCDLALPPCKDNRVLVTGGTDTTGSLVATAELYDPNSGSFGPAGGMAIARALHTANLLKDGTVLVAGPDQTAELFDPKSGTFAATGSMTAARSSHTATLLSNGTVLITGGHNLDLDSTVVALATAELYQ
jgi:hypothetical protein